MDVFPYLIAGVVCCAVAGVFGSIWWLEWRRKRVVKTLLARPGQVLVAWVEPPNDVYAVHCLKVQTTRGCKVAAVHADIQKVLPALEAKGIHVANAPDWCRDATKLAPVPRFDDEPEGGFSFFVNGILSPAMLLSCVIATIWAAFF